MCGNDDAARGDLDLDLDLDLDTTVPGEGRQQRRLDGAVGAYAGLNDVKATPVAKRTVLFRAGVFLDFVRLATRAEGPMWALNTRGEPNEIELTAANGSFHRSCLGTHQPPTPTLTGTPRQPCNVTQTGVRPVPLVPPHVRRAPCGVGAQHAWCLAA